MGANYNKLFKLMIDKKMRKGELCRQAGISGATLIKMSKGGNVNVDVLVRICHVLECDVGDIMDIEPKAQENEASKREES